MEQAFACEFKDDEFIGIKNMITNGFDKFGKMKTSSSGFSECFRLKSNTNPTSESVAERGMDDRKVGKQPFCRLLQCGICRQASPAGKGEKV
jgi:hypothetical protein